MQGTQSSYLSRRAFLKSLVITIASLNITKSYSGFLVEEAEDLKEAKFEEVRRMGASPKNLTQTMGLEVGNTDVEDKDIELEVMDNSENCFVQSGAEYIGGRRA